MSFIKNKLAQTLSVAFLAAVCSTTTYAAEKKESLKDKFSGNTIGLGYQFSSSLHGLSATMDLSDKVTGQAILGLFGDISHVTARARYHLASDQDWDAYGYASLGLLHFDDSDFDSETTLAVGGGIGMEYDWQHISADLPPIRWSFELDFNTADFDNHDLSQFSIGIGAHYRF